MEIKNNNINNDFFEYYSKKEKTPNTIKTFKKIGINTYTHNGELCRISEKKNKQNNLTIINETKNRQKQIKKYLMDSNKKEGIKTKIKENNNIKELNISEIKTSNLDNTIKNIKVNRMKINDIHKENGVSPNTNMDFYNKTIEKKKSFNINCIEQNKFQNKLNSNNFYYYFNNNKKNQRKSNIISVKSFNKNKDFINDQLLYSDYINAVGPFNQDNNNFSFYDYNILNNKKSKNNLTNNTFSNFTTTGPGKSQISQNSSKILINFKNIKTFYAHLEILISLYLKRNFKYFIEKVNEYNKKKLDSLDLYKNFNNKNGPIINVNNAHCSLFCSININPDNNNNNSNNNKLFNTVFNSTNTPLTEINEVENDESKILNKDFISNIKKNRLVFMNPEYCINLNESTQIVKNVNKSVYVPKNKIRKFNNNETLNEKKIKEIKEYKETNKNINEIKSIQEIKNIKNDVKQSSPIKEMNINLKKINVCRLNELNQLYSNKKLYNNNSSNISFADINNFLNLNNNNTTHSKLYSNNLIQTNENNNNTTSNLDDDKYRLKKISSAKNGIYIKPKDKIKQKIIKEIKIQNNQNKMNSPFKKEINSHNKKNKNIRIENLNTISNSFLNNKNIDLYPVNSYTNSNSKEKNIIKKIYIRRNSRNTEKEESNLDSNKNNCLSTLLSFKKENTKLQKEILIKQIKTSDLRMFINVKYFILNNKNKIKGKNKFDLLYLKNEHNNSISIIENKIFLTEYLDNNIKDNISFEVSNIFIFDNDKKEKYEKNINKSLIEFLIKTEEKVIKNIKKYIIKILKRNKLLRKIILNKNKKIINFYFSKFKKEDEKSENNINKNIHGIYHKINYNDDFNLNKRMKTPNNIKKYNKNIKCKANAYNLTSKNSINKHKIKVNNKNKRRELSINFNSSVKFINKEINIVVHNNNCISDKANQIKNKLFLFRTKLIKSILINK